MNWEVLSQMPLTLICLVGMYLLYDKQRKDYLEAINKLIENITKELAEIKEALRK